MGLEVVIKKIKKEITKWVLNDGTHQISLTIFRRLNWGNTQLCYKVNCLLKYMIYNVSMYYFK